MKIKSKNITKTKGSITPKNKERLLDQKGIVIWMSGLSGSGKSAIAHEVEKKLFVDAKFVVVLDGDNIRHGLNKDLGFSPKDRRENLRRIAEVAKLFADNGIIVLTSFISPTEESRKVAKKIIDERFKNVYIKCTVEECSQRDPKGLYKKAQNGEIKNFTGIDAPFEEPKDPDLVVDTKKESLEESAQKLYEFVLKSQE